MSSKNSNAITEETAVNAKKKAGGLTSAGESTAAGVPDQANHLRHTTETSDWAAFRITNPEDTRYLASDLTKFIQENKLFHNIQGKEYVNVEGWQYAGSRLGILPVVAELVRVRDGVDLRMVDDNGASTTTADRQLGGPAELKYLAKVNLFDLRTQQIVGTGFAICSNREPSKKYYQEFAIASMAQTRAIGKAYRNILAWIIRAAGYEPTPAEEMDYIAQPTAESREGGTPQRFLRSVKPLHEEVAQTQAEPVVPVRPAAKAEEPVAKETRPAPLESHSEELKRDAAQQDVAQPVTINQKTQILLLLNNSVITKEEKEKMVAKLNTFDMVRGDQAIAKLKKVIKERTTDSSSDMAA